ncbi:NAD(P)-dependent oxidoreductase [Companilactobacillus sp.]|jgi:3-hydroxyisobutyrate dehydrogenase|uniref:NAD(P)-dependent oxidoreductase n=3 Tax=Companilactobacillus sp. TaxID=2767905 RepID=UPI0025BEE0C5|nr:NAD(P)-dependent oxidoreductase [Companilactobacillus sp.]MCH4008983.1 NAD(P)-dependent oxidoreductase [Companilactobacillus sp.]MCH4050838.1 NAD(P)-dependent oxidoreductase [Companilactobacillus sp.]MCH4076926.1 NAD(P)-dependent oxidoreductase [Companilactobacillus sp.]MCH4125501.1 NAD(P)-dependent oxidoreductase [Companilactobacillus sp.]MCI1311210.1 NAD(P)-dependent oxidoreductase [Companilactobacillus sp.]
MKKIGFIGTGVMGSGIINNLLKANYDVSVYTRTESKAEPLLKEGAKWFNSPKDLTENVDIIFTMVGFPQDVKDVYLDPQTGVFTSLKAGQMIVDMTTSTPTLAKELGEKAEKMNVECLDAPVSGGDVGARDGKLTIMVGGSQKAYDELIPLFKVIGQSYHRFGSYGAGQHTKMANQIMIAGTMTGLTEMLVYAKAAGLDLPDVLKTLEGGGADNWSMENYVPRILNGDFKPGFFSKHFLKDLRIALEESEKMGLDLPATKQAKALYEKLVDDKGLGNDGTQALVKLWW